ncbi:MAG: hypothetical protein U1E15_09715 [Hyphomicrobiales bacterium]
MSAEGEGLYLSGTSEILGIVSSSKVPTPGVIAFAKCEGLVLHAGPTQSGGASVQWLGRLLGKTPAEISTLARRQTCAMCRCSCRIWKASARPVGCHIARGLLRHVFIDRTG